MIDPVERSEGGFRLYWMDQLKKLKIIKNLKASDFELESIREILTLKKRSDMGRRFSRKGIGNLRASDTSPRLQNRTVCEYKT